MSGKQVGIGRWRRVAANKGLVMIQGVTSSKLFVGFFSLKWKLCFHVSSHNKMKDTKMEKVERDGGNLWPSSHADILGSSRSLRPDGSCKC